MNLANLETALADYVFALSKSTDTTSRTEDRATYERHLVSVEVMLAAIHQGDVLRLKQIVDDETRAFGWGYLSGDEGSVAEAAWTRFVGIVRSAVAV